MISYGLSHVMPSSIPLSPAVKYIVALLVLGLSIDYWFQPWRAARYDRARGQRAWMSARSGRELRSAAAPACPITLPGRRPVLTRANFVPARPKSKLLAYIQYLESAGSVGGWQNEPTWRTCC